jgi:hypothetical protein
VPGGAAGLQNQSGGRKVPGGFDSLPSPPDFANAAPFQRKRFQISHRKLKNCPVKHRMPIADPKRPTAESSHNLIS